MNKMLNKVRLIIKAIELINAEYNTNFIVNPQ